MLDSSWFGVAKTNGTRESIQQQYADISKDDYNYYKDVYAPVENQLIDIANGGQDGNTLAKGLGFFDNLQGRTSAMQDRNMARFGAKQYGDNSLMNQLAATAKRAQYANDARNQMENSNLSLMQNMIGVGRQLNTNATGAIGSLAQQSNAINNQTIADNGKAMSNTMGTLGSLGMNMYKNWNSTPQYNSWGANDSSLSDFNSFDASNVQMSDFGWK
jgi:hypothetical protein